MALKVPVLPEKDLTTITGKAISVFEGGVKDVCIRLEGNPNVYYINRGLESGLELESLKKALINNIVTIKYPEHWLTNKAQTIHLSILLSEGMTFYNETI